MNKEERKSILYFLTGPRMFIYPLDANTITSFIQGYGYAKRFDNNKKFTDKLSDLIAKKYKIKYSATGWPGQIRFLSIKKSQDWTITFRNVGLEVVANPKTGIFEKDLKEIFRKRFIYLLFRINQKGDPWFNECWKEDWFSMCSVNSKWFVQIWTNDELKIIKTLDRYVKSKKIFTNKIKGIPTKELIRLKSKFEELNKYKNAT